MSKENNSKILMGSISQSLDKLIILGETGKESLSTLSILVEYFNYCLDQYNAGNEEYWEKMQVINNMIINLKNTCSNICNYKDRLLLTKYNTAPSIQDNLIILPISNSIQTLPYNEVVHNYSDPENDLISSIGLISKQPENNLLINGSPAVVNSEYAANSNFSAKYEYGSGNMFIIKNSTSLPCNSTIVAVDESGYNSAKQTHFLADANDGTNTIFKRIVNEVEELPNDTIIYIHIDTSSMAVPDQETIRDLALEWWDGFQTDNPDFEGSLLINTVPNSDIDPEGTAPGRENAGILTVPGNLASGGVEAWVDNPAQGLARQGWKEGLPNFSSEQEFIDYITDKSLVVLTFVDETNTQYHGNGVPISFTSSDIYQPTSMYINHYTSFLTKVRPYIKFFKGVLYPIIRTNNSGSNFLLHSLAAIEATTLTPTEIDTLMGPDVVAAFGANMQSYFYDNLATNNPYSNLNGLKGAGWEANFTKLSPASEVFTSEEFAEELDSILTDTSNVQVSFIDTIEVPSTDLGNTVSTDFSIKVRDNNAQQPLWSNVATIDIQYTSECEDTPLCGGKITSISIPHKENYIFQLSDFISPLDPQIDKIKITSIPFTQGQLKYYNLTVTSSHTPLVIPIQDIVDGHLSYISDSTVNESYNIEITYSLAYIGIDNYCSDENTISITKQANPNSPATIVTQDVEITLPTNSTTIPTTITYTGNGGYSIVWSKVSGPNQGDIVDNTVEDVQLENLVGGTYVFRCTVITDIDNYVTTADATVTVIELVEAFLATSEPSTILLPSSMFATSYANMIYRDSVTGVTLDSFSTDVGNHYSFDRSLTSNPVDIFIETVDLNNITRVSFSQSGFTDLDVTSFQGLTAISIDDLRMTSINLNTNPNLTEVSFTDGDLETIVIDQLIDLKILNLSESIGITTASFPENVNLERLHLSGTSITSVDTSFYPNLKLFYVDNTSVASLDLSVNTELTTIGVRNTNITNIDLTNNLLLIQVLMEGSELINPIVDPSNIIRIISFGPNNTDLTIFPNLERISIIGGNFVNPLVLPANSIVNYINSFNSTPYVMDEIIIKLDNSGITNGTLSLETTQSQTTPTSASRAAYDSLASKGWTLTGVQPPV